jgi:spore coat polysaccharide biosynthesis predicted glycosyltransferase SpsG
MRKNSDSSKQEETNASHKEVFRDEEVSPRIGDLYQDMNEFTEAKRRVQAFLRFKQTLLTQDGSNFTLLSEEFRRYRQFALEAIDRLFSNYSPSSNHR